MEEIIRKSDISSLEPASALEAIREAEGIIEEVVQKRREIADYLKEHGTGPDSWMVSRYFGSGQDSLMSEVARLLIARGEFRVHANPTQTECGPCLVVSPPHPYGSAW